MKKIILSLSLLVYCSTIIAQDFPIINPENVQIIRDEWGVPHIFGNTDAEAAYGLAWASAEDTFEDMQELLIAGKGMMGKFQGIKGAEADFFVHVIQVDELVDRKMKEMPEDFLKYIDGYAQGINKYAKLYPSKVALKNLFPIDTRDIIKSSVVMMSFITEAGGALSKIYNGKLDEVKTGLGSNAFAINSKKSTDGNTYLCINPHLQMTGSFSFYEAHMASNEGLNISGSLFLGGISVYMGNNENLGWGMTWNHFDQGDIYKLKMHPKKKLHYEYDGKWEKLEKKKVWLKVKVAKGIVLPVAKKSYWSKLGPVINSSKEKDNFYAFKYPAFYEITAPLQVYRMNKAKNFKEFKSALDIQGLGMFNIVYADKEENIFYLSSGQIPKRKDSLVNLAVIPGHLSENVWQTIHPLDELPQNLNPSSGYVFNTNNSPFYSDDTLDLERKLKSPLYMNLRPGNNNRAQRLIELFKENEKIDFETFQAMKFDNKYSKESYLYKKLKPIHEANLAEHKDISDILQKIQNWDLEADSNDISAAMVMVSVDFLFKKKGYGDKQFMNDLKASDEEWFAAVREAKAWFIEHYGTIEVPLGTIFKGKKGEFEVTSPGFPDALAANYGKRTGGKYILEYGDTYTHFVKFNKDGVEEMRTSVPFGNSYHPEDKSFFNQSELFRTQTTKKMSLNKSEIIKKAVKNYHPQ